MLIRLLLTVSLLFPPPVHSSQRGKRDLSSSAGAVIVDFPASGYILKTRPLLLHCVALHAVSIRFRCGSRWLPEARQLSHTTREGEEGRGGQSRSLLRAEVNISRADLDGDFASCECYATPQPPAPPVRSDAARIATAYIRKHFVQTASSTRVREGSSVALSCQPPEADPRAAVVWLKDGEALSVDGNVIVASDGSLLISATRLTDQGAYTCVASNIAGRRLASPAVLHVYVDGGWSEWSEWAGVCAVDCSRLQTALEAYGASVLPRVARQRICNNPAPMNGGLACPGQDEESRECELPCVVDGGWSTWSPWSACSSSCESSRSRGCDEPRPMNGGRSCEGEGREAVGCASGVCASDSSWAERLLAASSAAVLLLLFFLVAICLLLLLRRPPNTQPRSIATGYCAYEAEPLKHGMPEGDLRAVPPLYAHSSIAASASLRSYAREAREEGGSESRAALLPSASCGEGASSSTASSCRHAALLRTTSSSLSDDHYATVYECADAADRVVAARVDHRGATLSMHASSTSLLVPEGSFFAPTLVFLTTQSAEQGIPDLEENEMPLSAIVSVSAGGAGARSAGLAGFPEETARLPFVVSLGHCASSLDEWKLRLYANRGGGWQEEGGHSAHLHIHTHPSRVAHVLTTSFCKLLLAGRPLKRSATKRMRIAVFAPYDEIATAPRRPPPPGVGSLTRRGGGVGGFAPSPGFSLLLRVAIVPEGAADSLVAEEERGRRVAESHAFALASHGALAVCLEDMPPSFRIDDSYLEMSAEEAWSAPSGVECAFSIWAESAAAAASFSGRLVVLQKETAAPPHVLDLRLDSDYEEVRLQEESSLSVPSRLPSTCRDRLRSLLDGGGDRGWASVAHALRAPSVIPYAARFASPASVLLSLWESRREPLSGLAHALRLSGRPDAALVVEQLID